MTEALEKYQHTSAGFSLAKDELEEVTNYATLISKSGMVPECYKGNPGAILLAWDLGASVGLTRIQSLTGIATVGKQPSLWGDAALAVVMRSPQFLEIEEMEYSEIEKAKKATCIIKRLWPNGKTKVTKRSFSWADAVKAKLTTKATYTNHPWRMLQMRARALAMRDGFADVLKGLAIFEEVRDYIETKVENLADDIQARDEIKEPEEIKLPWYKSIFKMTTENNAQEITEKLTEAMTPVFEGVDPTAIRTADEIQKLQEERDAYAKAAAEKLRENQDERGLTLPTEEPDDDLGFISPEKVKEFWAWADSNGIRFDWIIEQLKLYRKIDTVDELDAGDAAGFCKMLLVEWPAAKAARGWK